MRRQPPRSTPLYSSAASDVYKRQDQIRVPPQITPRNQEVSDADHQHERAQQREKTAKNRQFFTNAQRSKGAGGEKGERDAEENIVNCGDGEQATIILFFGGIHALAFN